MAGVTGTVAAIVALAALTREFHDQGRLQTCAGVRMLVLSYVAVGLLGILGGIVSDFWTTRIFLGDFASINGPYKDALFLTGQGKRDEALQALAQYADEYERFTKKYAVYRPVVVRGDGEFERSMRDAGRLVLAAVFAVDQGLLEEGHQVLERVRPIYQDMQRRNGISPLSVALVDFHDAMELVLDAANERDVDEVRATVSELERLMGEILEIDTSSDIRTIASAVQDVRQAAEQGDADRLPGLGASLKSAFVKVYLARG
jgi:hypothetical protein